MNDNLYSVPNEFEELEYMVLRFRALDIQVTMSARQQKYNVGVPVVDTSRCTITYRGESVVIRDPLDKLFALLQALAEGER